MKSVIVLTPWFPNRPGDRAGAFVADSALAVALAGWRVGVLVVRPWLPDWAQRFAHEMIRGAVNASAFSLAPLETVRVPALPRGVLQRVTDIVADRMTANAAERMARSISADVIHVQTEGLVPIAARLARKLGLPWLVTVHGINPHPRYLRSTYQQRRLRPALASASRIVLVGEPLREFFKAYIGSDAGFRVVPNGIDVPALQPARQIPGEGGPRRLVSVSNLHEGKGIDLTLLALARLKSEGISDWTYRIIGAGREQAALLKLTTDLGLSDRVTFVGVVRHAEIFDHLASEEIFVLPSYREAFGIAYLEAMAAGLLTIGVTGQGPSQFITSGVNGILVPPRDVDALAAALREVLTGDPQRWREVAGKGRETVQSAYTWDHHAKQLIDVYEEAVRAYKILPKSCSCNQIR